MMVCLLLLPEDLDPETLDDGLTLYRNLALSRLVKKALDNGHRSARSGSRAPGLSALWKTRVG